MEDLDALLAQQAELAARIDEAKKANRTAVVERVKKDIKEYAITVTELRSVLKTRKRKAASDAASTDGEKKPRGRGTKTKAAG